MRIPRLFTTLLLCALTALLLPAAAALAAPAAYVQAGNVRLNDGDRTTAFGGTASYQNGVLSLDGVTIPAAMCFVSGNARYGIHAQGDLTIELSGNNSVAAADAATANNQSNAVHVDGNLTITGTGSLEAFGGGGGYMSNGIHVEAGNLLVTGGSVRAKAANGLNGMIAGAQGISVVALNDPQAGSIGGRIVVNGGSLLGEAGDASGQNISLSHGISAQSIHLQSGTLSGVGADSVRTFSWGVYTRDLTITGGTMIAVNRAVPGAGAALEMEPNFGTPPIRYEWKAGSEPVEPAGNYFLSDTQPFLFNPDDRYVAIRLYTPPPTPTPVPTPTPTPTPTLSPTPTLTPSPNPSPAAPPDTGDSALPLLWLCLLAFSAVAAAVGIRRARNRT